MPVGRWVIRTAESVTLTCWPPAPLERYVSIAQVLVVDLDLDVLVDLGRHVDRRERGVPPLRRVERGDAHEPVHAHLPLEVAVGVIADHVQRRALEARLFPVLPLDQLGLPAPLLREAQVHAQQHLRPVLRLRAAGAGVDREPRVVLVLGRAHLHGQLELVAEGSAPPRAPCGPRRPPVRPRAGARRACRARPSTRRAARPSRASSRARASCAGPPGPPPAATRSRGRRLSPSGRRARSAPRPDQR